MMVWVMIHEVATTEAVFMNYQFTVKKGPNSAILILSVAAVDLHSTLWMLNLADIGNCSGPSASTTEP